MTEPTPPRTGWLILAMLVCTVSPAAAFAQPVPDVDVRAGTITVDQSDSRGLVSARFSTKTDAMGFQWGFDQNGGIQYGTNSVFRMAEALVINGSGFSSSSRQMTPDGEEYNLVGSRDGVTVRRQIRFDSKRGLVRYVDSFFNPAASPVTVNVGLSSMLRNTARGVLTDEATPVTTSLGDGGTGLVAWQSSNTTPSVLFYLAAKDSQLKPVIMNQGNSRFTFSYTLQIPPQKIVSVLHGIAQRRLSGQPDAAQLANLFAPFHGDEWLVGIDQNVRQTIANRTGSVSLSPSGPLLQAAINLADHWRIDASEQDVLVLDAETQLAGDVPRGPVRVTTRFGETTADMDDVVAIVGGAGIGRNMRIFLRNGEVFSGAVDFGELPMQTSAGVDLNLYADQVNVLFLRSASPEGRPQAGTAAIVETQSGDQLAIERFESPHLSAATAWGPIDLPLDRIIELGIVREPQPMHRVLLKEGSALTVMLFDEAIAAHSKRFGPVSLPAAAIARLTAIESPEETEEETESADTGDKVAEPSGDAAKDKERVAQLLSAAREAFKQRQFDVARDLIAEARQYDVEYGLFDDRPELVMAEMARRRNSEAITASTESPAVAAESLGQLDKVPHWELAGKNFVAGTFAAAELELLTASGPVTLDTAEIISMRPADGNGGQPMFQIGLADGSRIEGRLLHPVLDLTVDEHLWKVPVVHVVAFKRPTKTAEPERKAQEQAPTDAEDATPIDPAAVTE